MGFVCRRDSGVVFRSFSATLILVLSSCGGGSSGGGSTSTTGTSAFNCGGERVWGPLAGQPEFYVSEASGSASAPNCVREWRYSASAGCSSLEDLDTELSARVLSNGSVEVEDSADGQTYTLAPANISFNQLNEAPTCEADGDDGSSNDSGNSGSGGFDCNGSRVWGPIEDEAGIEVYLSEARGSAPPPGCVRVWDYSPSRNCSSLFDIDTDLIPTVQSDGSLSVEDTFDGTVFTAPVANISLDQLDNAPDC